MWRTLLRPRWLALLAALMAVVAVFAWLGLWQLSVARNDALQQAQAQQATRPVAPLAQVLVPHGEFPADGAGRPVLARGSYDADRQFLIPGRLLEGEPGYWVVTPLAVDATGARLPVVRGFVADPGEADRPAAGGVAVTGTLAPGESPAPPADLPGGQRGSLDLSVLANEWPGPLYNAFLFATAEEPQVTGASVTPVPPPTFGGDVDWRNLGYALQWWVFAAFAVFMFWKLLREEHRARAGSGTPRHTLEVPEERTQSHHV